MKYSIIVPTYNEELDIRDTLETLIKINYPNYEVIVVDDSTDSTPDIVREYEANGVKLIIPQKKEGRCGARNVGIRAASGDIVIILNADTHLDPEFINKINTYYKQGFDYVLVTSEVKNMDDLFARYVECTGRYYFYDNDIRKIEWTEGYSCRREMAIEAGLFPTGFPINICAGEDGYFGENMRNLGAKKYFAKDIVVYHVAPASFKEYWHIRKGRGAGSPQVRRYLHKWSISRCIAWASLRVIKNFISTILVLPNLYTSIKVSKYSPHKYRDIFPFFYSKLIEDISFSVGEFQSIKSIIRAEKKHGI